MPVTGDSPAVPATADSLRPGVAQWCRALRHPDEISIDGPLTGYCPGGASDTPDPAARETEIGWLIFRAGSAG